MLCSNGNIFVNGSIGTAAVTAFGTGTETLIGVLDAVTVDIAGLNTVQVSTPNGESKSYLLDHKNVLCIFLTFVALCEARRLEMLLLLISNGTQWVHLQILQSSLALPLVCPVSSLTAASVTYR